MWLPFDLHPEYPGGGIERQELEARYGEGFHGHVQEMIERAGFGYDPPNVIPNSKRSLELAELARDKGKFDELHPLLFQAYWSDHQDIGDSNVLERLATKAGLDAEEMHDALSDGRYDDRIRFMTQTALELGADGVPTWLVDDQVLVSGAQPHELFERLMADLGHEATSER